MFGQFLRCVRMHMQLAEAAAHPASLMWASYGLGFLSLRQGDLSKALPLLERAVGICQDADLPAWSLWMAATLSAAYMLVGRGAEAMPLLTQALAQTAATGMVIDQTRGVVVGITLIGPSVGELIHAATIAIVGAVPISRLWHAVPSFPTISEVWLRLLETAGL